MLPAWEEKLKDVLLTGKDSEDATSPQHAGSTKQTSKIEKAHPGHTRELF